MMYYDTEENTGTRAGWIAVLLYALLWVGLMLCVVFRMETPSGSEGILIDFGNAEAAAGLEEPAQQQPSASSGNPAEMLTQDVEEAPEVVSPPDPSQSRTPDTPRETVPAEPERQVDKRALFPGSNAGSSSASQGSSAAGTGNQGAPDGQPGADNTAGAASGTSFSLSGRDLRERLPEPAYSVDVEGTVNIDIKVNGRGDVVQASYRALGSTTSDGRLVRAALEAARKAKFSESEQEVQFGYITYRFRLQ